MSSPQLERAWAVLPVKPFDWAKTRLDGVLRPPERAELARRLMAGSLRALLDSGCFERVVVVSRDAEALELAASAGAFPLTEEAPADLNHALALAAALAVEQGATGLLVLASDLPLVTAGDIRAIVEAWRQNAAAVIVPDRRREGTNSLMMRPPRLINFAFGPGSFERHQSLVRAAGAEVLVLDLPGIAFDVDLPEDLSALETSETISRLKQ